MLSSISWQQYLAAITAITVAYYLYVALRYYRKEITGFVAPKQVNRTSPISVPVPHNQIMGLAKPDQGVLSVDLQDLRLAFNDDPEMENDSAEQQAIATKVKDPNEEILNDVTHLLKAFKDIDDKPEFLSLLRIQFSSYRMAADQIDWAAVKKRTLELAYGKLPFVIAEVDLQLDQPI